MNITCKILNTIEIFGSIIVTFWVAHWDYKLVQVFAEGMHLVVYTIVIYGAFDYRKDQTIALYISLDFDLEYSVWLERVGPFTLSKVYCQVGEFAESF